MSSEDMQYRSHPDPGTTIKSDKLSVNSTSTDRITVERGLRSDDSFILTFRSHGDNSKLALTVACLDPVFRVRLAHHGAKWVICTRRGSSAKYAMALLGRLPDAWARSGKRGTIQANGEYFGPEGIKMMVDDSNTRWTVTFPDSDMKITVAFGSSDVSKVSEPLDESNPGRIERDTAQGWDDVPMADPSSKAEDADESDVDSDDSDTPLIVLQRRRKAGQSGVTPVRQKTDDSAGPCGRNH